MFKLCYNDGMEKELSMEYGYCHCGCGTKTSISRQNNELYAWVIGEPRKFVQGHASRINPSNRKGKKTGRPSPARITESEMIGFRYGRLVVESFNSRDSKTSIWNCVCDCGEKCLVKLGKLRSGTTKSCGCYQQECRVSSNRTHGMSGSKEFELLHAAKHRSKKKGLDFNLELSDIIIPEKCPYFDIVLKNGSLSNKDNSPSIDRIDSSLGYVKGNIEIISWRANQIKSNGTGDDHLAIGSRMKLLGR
jgi:hypothetical protein